MLPPMSLRTRALIARAPTLTASRLLAAVGALGSLEALADAPSAQLAPFGLTEGTRAWLAAPDLAQVDADVAWIEAAGARIVAATDPE